MKRGALLSVLAVASLSSGCAQRWGERWATLPSDWRSDPHTSATSVGLAMGSGMKGFRYAGTLGWIYAPPSDLAISLGKGEVRQVVWIADPVALHGVLFRDVGGYHFLLTTTRSTLRFAATTELILVDKDGLFAATLPKIDSFYSLDAEQAERTDLSSKSVLCTSAEAALLAKFEIGFLARDRKRERISDEEANEIRSKLAPLLSSDVDLCS